MASDFQRTDIPNLDRHLKYGTYYGRVKLRGKLIRESFGDNKRVAMEKLTGWLVNLRGAKRVKQGTLNSLTERYLVWLANAVASGDINEETELYKQECLKAIRSLWPEFSTCTISKLTPVHLASFRHAFRAKYSASRTNGAITVVREIFQLAKTDGYISINQLEELTDAFKYTKVKYDYQRLTMELPSPEELAKIRYAVHTRCSNKLSDGGDLFDFLLLSGSRIEAATSVTWRDVDWDRNTLYFSDAKIKPYDIPLFPELREFLLKLKASRPKAKPEDKILTTKSLHTVLASVSAELRPGKPKLKHHTLRHLFATRCIEAGKDLITVAGWMGHHDNGRTVMLVYGHLRKAHSQAEAKDMTFIPKVEPVKVESANNAVSSENGKNESKP
jgi:integrase